MATKTVEQSPQNLGTGSWGYEVTIVLNAVASLINEIRDDLRTKILAGDPGFAINSNFDIANASAFAYMIDGVPYTLAASQNFDTGTSEVLASNKWGVALLSVDSSGSTTVTWSGSDFDSEAAALAAIPDPPANECPVGVVTVKTATDNNWTAGTDALKGGTGGNAASETNYYDGAPTPLASAAVDDLTFAETGTPS